MDDNTKRGVATQDFNDAGTGKSYEAGKAYDFEAGQHHNFTVAGLIADETTAPAEHTEQPVAEHETGVEG